MRKDIALTRFCLVKYLLPAPLEVQYMNVLEKPMRFRFEDKIDNF